MQKGPFDSQSPTLITRPPKPQSMLIFLGVLPVLVGLLCLVAWLFGRLTPFEAAMVCLFLGVPWLSYLCYAGKQVTLDRRGLTHSRFGKRRRIEASDLVSITINHLDDNGVPAFYRVRGRHGERFSFRVEKSKRDAVFKQVEQFVTTNLSTQKELDMGYVRYFIPLMCATAIPTVIFIALIGEPWTLPMIAAICLATLVYFHCLVRLSLKSSGLTLTYLMPWRATRHYAWSEIVDLELRQKGRDEEAQVVLALRFAGGGRLRPTALDCGNYLAYTALQTWRDRALRNHKQRP